MERERELDWQRLEKPNDCFKSGAAGERQTTKASVEVNPANTVVDWGVRSWKRGHGELRKCLAWWFDGLSDIGGPKACGVHRLSFPTRGQFTELIHHRLKPLLFIFLLQPGFRDSDVQTELLDLDGLL